MTFQRTSRMCVFLLSIYMKKKHILVSFSGFKLQSSFALVQCLLFLDNSFSKLRSTSYLFQILRETFYCNIVHCSNILEKSRTFTTLYKLYVNAVLTTLKFGKRLASLVLSLPAFILQYRLEQSSKATTYIQDCNNMNVRVLSLFPLLVSIVKDACGKHQPSSRF